jgi:hypothetical protein
MLPSKILVVEEWSVIQNTTVVNRITLANNDASSHKLGARLLLDIQVGSNDGAPIYIPGIGLITTENEFIQSRHAFGYWNALNRADHPTIVATGFIDSKDGMTSPDKMVVADWKQGRKTAWVYNIDREHSIMQDSSVILYYNPITVQPGKERNIQQGFGVGEYNGG